MKVVKLNTRNSMEFMLNMQLFSQEQMPSVRETMERLTEAKPGETDAKNEVRFDLTDGKGTTTITYSVHLKASHVAAPDAGEGEEDA